LAPPSDLGIDRAQMRSKTSPASEELETA
jgi:hypothetical protein